MKQSFFAKRFSWFKGHAQGQPRRDAFCSFCRKSYRDTGPLVEGPLGDDRPGEVLICRACIRHCDQILDQVEPQRAASTLESM